MIKNGPTVRFYSIYYSLVYRTPKISINCVAGTHSRGPRQRPPRLCPDQDPNPQESESHTAAPSCLAYPRAHSPPAAHLDSELAKIDALTTEAQRAIDLLQERRTALISAAVTGQIDVRPLAERQSA
jgi:hypothetical protein